MKLVCNGSAAISVRSGSDVQGARIAPWLPQETSFDSGGPIDLHTTAGIGLTSSQWASFVLCKSYIKQSFIATKKCLNYDNLNELFCYSFF